MQLTILGDGAWGTALAIKYARSHEVVLWGRSAEQCLQMQTMRVNQRYLPNIPFPSSLEITNDLQQALSRSKLALLAVSIAGMRPVLSHLFQTGVELPPLLWACKGFEAKTGLLPHEVCQEVLPEIKAYGVLSGPSFAYEVASGQPAAVTIATNETQFTSWIVQTLNSQRLRLYTNTDLIGVEVGGAVKNVMAIATGVADGLQMGMNARAALITRGLAEISRLAVALGGQTETMMGLAGMGDLILTCTGSLSRNRQVGLKLAEGKPLSVILDELGHVAEGVFTAREVQKLAKTRGIDMPITEAVCCLLDNVASPDSIVMDLMAREPKAE